MLTRLRPASSKADIFEAKVASAVDEADSSDSEETFVYESNPPDVSDRPRRFHSRTPSATSMASQIDQRNGVLAMMEANKSVAMKKSMKFANSYNTSGQDSTNPEDDGKGTIRGSMGTNRGTTHHHHIGGSRWGRNVGNGHPSLFDNESPFPNASKSKVPANISPRQSPQFEGSRMSNLRVGGKKTPMTAGYDCDDTADDERTPLINTVRSSRSGRSRRLANSIRQHQTYRENKSCFSRNAGCLILLIMFILVAAGGIGFYFATTVALTEVKILALKNVLASEQEVMLDMKVQARNANLVAVTIDTSDLVIFAKSKYAGTDEEWWKSPSGPDGLTRRRRRRFVKRDDDPLDPPLGDDPNTNPNLEIGRVYEFYSPLVFDASPFNHVHETSLGQIRVNHPGNRTVPSGSERWGRVLQHEFDLIVCGTLKYTLPLSQRTRSVSVEGRVTVKPNAADQDPDTVHIIEGSSVINMI